MAICDRCRVAGTAGGGDISHLGDLLEFEPVPQTKERVDGWSEEHHRALEGGDRCCPQGRAAARKCAEAGKRDADRRDADEPDAR